MGVEKKKSHSEVPGPQRFENPWFKEHSTNGRIFEKQPKVGLSLRSPLNCFADDRKDHEKAEFEVHEVYAVDVLVSTGEGKVSDVMFMLFFFY